MCARACVRMCVPMCVRVRVREREPLVRRLSEPMLHRLSLHINLTGYLPHRYHVMRVVCPAMPANLMCNKFGHRRVVVVGGVLMNMGFVLSTFAKELWMLYFTYGILIGR